MKVRDEDLVGFTHGMSSLQPKLSADRHSDAHTARARPLSEVPVLSQTNSWAATCHFRAACLLKDKLAESCRNANRRERPICQLWGVMFPIDVSSSGKVVLRTL